MFRGGTMQEIMIAIVAGILLGWFDVFGYKVKLTLSRLSTACLFLMLVCLGAKIGCDADLLAQIEVLGWQSLLLGGMTIIGSLLALYPVTVIFRSRAESGEVQK